MKTFNYTITDPVGMHVRPAGKLVALAKTFASSISISGNGKQADCKRMIALTSLGIKHSDTIEVKIEGADEEAATAAIQTFLSENL